MLLGRPFVIGTRLEPLRSGGGLLLGRPLSDRPVARPKFPPGRFAGRVFRAESLFSLDATLFLGARPPLAVLGTSEYELAEPASPFPESSGRRRRR